MGSISIREYIRWLPDDASEPTSTIVLTSPQRRYVDLRFLLSAGDDGQAAERTPLERLDWAIAGTSSSSTQDDGRGRHFTHSKWHHWIDSRNIEAEKASDEGDMFSQPDGTTLEKGRMVNPATGRDTDYEELWRDPEPIATTHDGTPGEKAQCVVLQLHHDERGERGMVIRLGQFCQGLLRSGESLTVERWEWAKSGGWKLTERIGDGLLPCDAVLDDGISRLGKEIKSDNDVWSVIEKSS